MENRKSRPKKRGVTMRRFRAASAGARHLPAIAEDGLVFAQREREAANRHDHKATAFAMAET